MADYIHGTDESEQARLGRLNGLMNQGSLKELRLQRGERVLDVGCGLGLLAAEMARIVGPEGCVLGVDASEDQLREARRNGQGLEAAAPLEHRLGDALDLPLKAEEWGTFDVVHARYVLEHLSDPLGAVRQMMRAVRPGGRIVLEDDDHDSLRLWPEPPGVWSAWAAYMRIYERLGCDPYIGRRLVTLLHQAGALPRRNNLIFFGSCSGHEDFAAIVANLAACIEDGKERAVAAGIHDAAYIDAGIEALRAWGRRPDASVWYGICCAEGVRPR